MVEPMNFEQALDQAENALLFLEGMQRHAHIGLVAQPALTSAIDATAAVVRRLQLAVKETEVPGCRNCGIKGQFWTVDSPAVCPECKTRR